MKLYDQWRDDHGLTELTLFLQGRKKPSMFDVVEAVVRFRLPFNVSEREIESTLTKRKWRIYFDKFDVIWFSEL